MRVCLDVEPLWYKAPGGIATYTANLVSGLIRRGHDVVGYQARHSGRPSLLPDTTSLTRIGWPRPILFESWSRIPFPNLKCSGANLIHATTHVVPPTKQTPVITTIHDLAFLRFPEFFPRYGRGFHARAAAAGVRRADGIIAVSQATKAEIHALLHVPMSNIEVIYPGVELPTVVDGALRRRRLQIPEKYILWVGTLQPRKNLEGVLQALALLPDADIALVVCGPPGWKMGRIFEALDPHLRDRVILLGQVAQEDLVSAYQGARCLVYPSLYEGFGLPVAEAMLIGCPVVTSDRSSMAEIATGAAVLCDPLDGASIASAIESVLSDEALSNFLVDAGRKRAGEFTWRRCLDATVDLYEKVAGR